MKLKQQPEDFRVEEQTDAVPEGNGVFAFYRLEKTGWTTPDALAAIRRRWQIESRRLSYGGLKDRHAVTAQHITIARGPKRDLLHERITLTYLGQRTAPFTANDISANRFTITMRALTDTDVAGAERALVEVADSGLPNYFDDQRFGSVGEKGEFVAKEMVLGRFERALWLALAAPYEHDRAEAKREKTTLRDWWGKWPECQAKLPKGHARSIVSYLAAHPVDFKGAVARLRPDLHGLYLSAYQSCLWNRMLALWLASTLHQTCLVELDLKLGRVPAPRTIPLEHRAAWEELLLPLPSARVKPEPGVPWRTILEQVVMSEGLTLPELKIKGMQKPFFSKGDRAGCVRPRELSSVSEADELNRGKRKLILRFELPRGSYATILVKRISVRES